MSRPTPAGRRGITTGRVVRDKAVLPVDLAAAVTQKGDAKTNYQLKAGDQLFVQVKVPK